MPRLSIVIPCVHDDARFETTLASVLQNRPDDCEVLVVQPRSYSDPYELKDEVRFVEGPVGSSLADLVNLGIRVAQAAVVHLLSCDIEVLDGWTERAISHFQDSAIAAVSPLVVYKGTPDQVVARGVRYSVGGARRAFRGSLPRRGAKWRHVLGPTLAAGFYRRQLLLDLGGFRSDVGDELADVDVALRLQSTGHGCLHEDSSIVTTEVMLNRPPLSFRSGREAERFFWCHARGAQRTTALLAHPCSVAAELIGNLPRPRVLFRMLGRVTACLEQMMSGHRATCASTQQSIIKDEALGVLPWKSTSSPDSDKVMKSRAAA